MKKTMLHKCFIFLRMIFIYDEISFILPYSVKEISVIIWKELSEANLDLLAQRLYYRQR